jgi:hypothetical protein
MPGRKGSGISSRGVMVIGIGERAREEARLCEEALGRSNPGLEVEIIDEQIGMLEGSAKDMPSNVGRFERWNVGTLEGSAKDMPSNVGRFERSNVGTLEGSAKDMPLNIGKLARRAKVRLDELSPFELTLYLDADTRAQGDLAAGFEMLEDGWDLVICASEHQGEECMWHVGEGERRATLEELGYEPMQLQAGMFFFRKSEGMRRLFEAWREEWGRWMDQDQAALLRALARAPMRTWILGRPWNGGAVVQHLYGRCR